jgi:hypothetical protein
MEFYVIGMDLRVSLGVLQDILYLEKIVCLSSYDQTLFIGNGGAHPKPAAIYVRLHELLARIFKLRGQPDYYQHNLDVDDE